MSNEILKTTRLAKTGFTAYLVFTAAMSGALVMVVEVLGSRVIGPYFGVSLFVWTALISVTLLSLSAGYAIGGRLSDKHPSPDWLYALIVASGFLVALVPVLKFPVIEATTSLGLRGGALVSAFLLFGPALLLLGCVSPFVVKVATSDIQRLGSTLGLFYAVSTAGSFAGTAATGFFIIAYLGVSKAFYVCGLALCALGVFYFLFFRSRFLSIFLLAPFAFGLPVGDATVSVQTDDGTTVTLIDSGDSFYGNVKIVEYKGALGSSREMMIDGLIQGGVDPQSGQSIYEYSYLMEHLPLAVKPGIETALFIGLGPGVVVSAYQARGIKCEVVDIDPLVAKMAEKHFGFRPLRPVILADGRTVLNSQGPKYHSIFMDVFNGDITPGHLLSREAIQQVRSRLTDDGVFALNIIGSFSPSSRLLPLVANTLRSEFSDVIAFPLFDASNPETVSGNLVILASNASLEKALALRNIPSVHPLAESGVKASLAQGVRLKSFTGALLLTDDFNPLDVFDAELHEEVRRTIVKTTPARILLHG